jgi:hypothetical protein
MTNQSKEAAIGRWAYAALVAVCLVAAAVGIFARTQGLEGRPLAEDEYYWVTSVESVAEHGIHRFPDGGYYLRALVTRCHPVARGLAFT